MRSEPWADVVVCVCSSQRHYHYLENVAASADDSTGHMVKVIARWQAASVLKSVTQAFTVTSHA